MQLQIKYPDGSIERRPLPRRSQLLIGSSSACDVLLDDPLVEAVHLRLTIGRHGEVNLTATGSGTVYVNREEVRTQRLAVNDHVLLGDTELLLIDESSELLSQSTPPPSTRGKLTELPPSGAMRLQEIEADKKNELISEPTRVVPARPWSVEQLGESNPSVPGQVTDASLEIVDDPETEPEPPQFPSRSEGRQRREHRDDRSSSRENERRLALKVARRSRERDENVFRSPLVLWLMGGAAALLLLSGTLWFILNRDATERQYAAAKAAFESAAFSQAIELFEKFLVNHGNHSYGDEAQLYLAKARVEQPLSGTSPAWPAAFEAVDQFVRRYENEPTFNDAESPAREYLVQVTGRMTLQAGRLAVQSGKREYLERLTESRNLFDRFVVKEAIPQALLAEIVTATTAAEAAVIRWEAIEAVRKSILAALEKSQVQSAMESYFSILQRYPDARSNRVVQEMLAKILDADLRLTQRIETPEASPTAAAGQASDPPAQLAGEPLTWVRRTRSRSDLASSSDVVFATAGGTCFALDAGDGNVLWQRPHGISSRMFPTPVEGRVPSVLVEDQRRRTLFLLNRRTAEVLWARPLDSSVAGLPLLRDGQLYVTTIGGVASPGDGQMFGGSLWQLDLLTGDVVARYRFTQRLSGPPIDDPVSGRLFVAGEQRAIYVLTTRPLALERVFATGHPNGSITAAMMRAGSYLILAQNDSADSSRLRMFDLPEGGGDPREIAGVPLTGVIRDPGVVRGKLLFVTHSGERLSALTVADTHDAKALTLRASIQVAQPAKTAMSIAAGPDDQVWVCGSALRRYQLLDDTLRPLKPELATGLAAQPLQASGESVYVGRHLPYSNAVVLLFADRLRMQGIWQTTLGAAVTSVAASADDASVIVLNNAGDVFRVATADVAAGGIRFAGEPLVTLPAGIATPLRTGRLSADRFFIACGGESARLWIIDGSGRVESESPLDTPLQADPVILGGGIVLPISGRLRIVDVNGLKPIAEDYLAAVQAGGKTEEWRSVQSYGDNQLVACDAAGRIAKIELREGNTRHLAEVASWSAGQSVDLPPVLFGDSILLVDSARVLHWLDAASFDPRGKLTLASTAAAAPILAGTNAVVPLGDGSAVVVSLAEELKALQTVAFRGDLILGAIPVDADRLVLISAAGRVAELSLSSGRIVRDGFLPSRVSVPPVRVGNRYITGGEDGSVFDLTPWLSEGSGESVGSKGGSP